MDSTIDRVLSYYVKKYGKTAPHNIDKAVNYIYENVSISVDDNVSRSYIYKRFDKILTYQLQLKKLKKISVIEQRSPEWYEARQTMISASDFGQALNKGLYGTQREFLIKKITGKSKEISFKAPLFHGIKFEDVVIALYSKRNRVKVNEFGLLRHTEKNYIGASPDGISSNGIMLEIKCPYKRKIDGKIKEQYYYQIQGQLEVCNLNECDFLECEFDYYKDENEFLNDIDELKESGIIISYRNNEEKDYKYYYSNLDDSKEKIVKWKENELSKFDILTDFKVEYWKIRKYHCQRVYRDVKFFNDECGDLKTLWDKIEYFRKEENKKELITTIINNKKNKIYDFSTKPDNKVLSGFAFKNVENDYVDVS